MPLEATAWASNSKNVGNDKVSCPCSPWACGLLGAVQGHASVAMAPSAAPQNSTKSCTDDPPAHAGTSTLAPLAPRVRTTRKQPIVERDAVGSRHRLLG